MKVNSLPSFTQLSLKNVGGNSKSTQFKNLSIASKLDSSANKYSTGQYKTQPVSSHYRNTFVEMQQQNFLSRLNKL